MIVSSLINVGVNIDIHFKHYKTLWRSYRRENQGRALGPNVDGAFRVL